jgi:hypothetical protein
MESVSLGIRMLRSESRIGGDGHMRDEDFVDQPSQGDLDQVGGYVAYLVEGDSVEVSFVEEGDEYRVDDSAIARD